ncbi:hypothetical protein HanRHA438_Chr10g0433741 [Helianthus annuus]|nr:hypothetical protein HanRHA438_Chr10g0433741 [Helianthus annuus]
MHIKLSHRLMNLLQILDFGSAKPDFGTDFGLFHIKLSNRLMDMSLEASSDGFDCKILFLGGGCICRCYR